jgi:unsaturated chondroitin disaccharide hydrolase
MFCSKSLLEDTLNKLAKTTSRVKDGVPYRTINGIFDNKENEIDWWTNGFWGGLLWLAYRETNKQEYLQWANGLENKLDAAMKEFYHIHHDVGFMWQLTSVANYKLTGNELSAKRGLMAASIIASRFNPKGSYIRAWNGVEHNGWAIIDCMMNLSILYWAAGYMKDPHFSNIAQAHAETAMKYFIREDGSAKHICVFNPETGEYIENLSGQGYGANSAWSRGAAWALYGFTISAKYTGRTDFLDTAKRVANFFISHLPVDYVPFSDFKAPAETNIHKDSSAAACAASGLVLLSKQVDTDESACYREAAEKILESLYRNYTDWENDEALLQKGCTAYFSEPENLETSLIYGDYFFLEALVQLCGKDGLF